MSSYNATNSTTALQNASRRVDEEHLVELLAMSTIDYDRVRKDAAMTMGIRVSVLDNLVEQKRREANPNIESNFIADVEPWDETVDGHELLTDLVSAIERHAKLPTGAAEAIALWTVFAHAHDAARHSPILTLTSPEKRCGKTTVLSLIECLVPRPVQSSNITSAATFRAVDRWNPTLLIDEADTFLDSGDELRGILNSGHRRSSAYVIRAVGEDHEPRQFRTWAPKAIAMIGNLKDTLADRSINIPLRRRLPGEHVEPVNELAEAELRTLNRKTARWVKDNLLTLKNAQPSFPSSLHDRAQDNWRIIFAIADLADGDWPERIRNAAEALTINDDEGSAAVMLLADIKEIFAERDSDKISSADLVHCLNAKKERPWSEWRRGNEMTVRSLSKLLSPFIISPGVIRIGSKTIRGYRHEQFTDTWNRYLSQESLSEASQRNKSQKSANNEQFQNVTINSNVTDGNTENQQKSSPCYGVTDISGETRKIGEQAENIELEEHVSNRKLDDG
ncbi:MAG: DUF3631 domain-containing protein [Fimbriimonadaceae bacterium]|nr:DUF3631 domain-containing protein [Alphaproteobacteria bacterium]